MDTNVTHTSPSVKLHFSWHPDTKNLRDYRKYENNWRSIEVDNLKRYASAVTKCMTSPSIFRYGVRAQSHFEFADFGALDFDGGEDMQDIAKRVCDTISIIGPTKTKNHFRLFFKWSRPITTSVAYTYNMRRVAEHLSVDRKCLESARMYAPCREIYQIVEEGFSEEVQDIPEGMTEREVGYQLCYEKYSAYGQTGMFDSYLRNVLQYGVDEGEKNDTCFRVALYLKYWGMDDDKILSTVLDSPIPMNNPKAKREAERAVKSGIRRAEETIKASGSGTSTRL